MTPTIFINVFRVKGREMSFERNLITSRAEAIEDAEAYADEYAYTLSDAGMIDLRPEFSEAYHEQRDFDATVDARIDEMKEREFAGEARGA
jgi:hypothetical protein